MILEMIKTQCAPRQNCMLTIISDKGETGFLYFKDAQLIEANYGSVWGQDAFLTILTWGIVRHSIGELPTGIKRTIWQTIDEIVAHAQKTTGLILNTQEKVRRCSELEGFLAWYEEEKGQMRLLAGHEMGVSSWLETLKQKAQEVTGILNAGKLRNFYVANPEFQIWNFAQQEKNILIIARADADFFEANLKEIL
ncbi:MAG: hypothetical protein ACOY3I_01190 [Verrucomicrobiota bacterium]